MVQGKVLQIKMVPHSNLDILLLSLITLEDLIKSIHNSCIFVNMFAMNWNILTVGEP